MMTEGHKIFYTAIAAFIIWMAQKVIAYFVIRSRITQSLLSEIELNIDGIKKAYAYLKKFERNYLVIGGELGYVDRFTKSESGSSFFTSQLDDLSKYYGRKTLDKILKLHYGFWELQIAIEGFTTYLSYLSDKDIALSNNEIERAKKKLSRIYTLIEVIIKNKINTLSDLPENYEGSGGPDSTISPPSQHDGRQANDQGPGKHKPQRIRDRIKWCLPRHRVHPETHQRQVV